MKRISTQLLIVGSSLLMLWGLYYTVKLICFQNQSPLSTDPVSSHSKQLNYKNLPSHLDIPQSGISIDVETGDYDPIKQAWSESDNKALYALPTTEPNSVSGNTLIYGHNRPNIFGNLVDAEIGQSASLRTVGGSTYNYTLIAIYDTDPADVSIFSYQGPPRLTLQTCTGLFYQNRRMFVFNLDKVS